MAFSLKLASEKLQSVVIGRQKSDSVTILQLTLIDETQRKGVASPSVCLSHQDLFFVECLGLNLDSPSPPPFIRRKGKKLTGSCSADKSPKKEPFSQVDSLLLLLDAAQSHVFSMQYNKRVSANGEC